VVRAKKPARLPTVLTHEEVRSILQHLKGVHWLAVMLLYGSGLRLLECLGLRIKDVDFGYRQIMVREGKGKKDLARKYPHANREWAWQWVFPASRHFSDPESGLLFRHNLHESVIQRAVGVHKRMQRTP